MAVLMDPERHAVRYNRGSGPALLSAYDMVPIRERVLGNRVVPVRLPQGLFFQAARL